MNLSRVYPVLIVYVGEIQRRLPLNIESTRIQQKLEATDSHVPRNCVCLSLRMWFL